MTSSILGVWDLALKTPIGTLKVQYRFTECGDVLEGAATGTAETVPLHDVATERTDNGERITWRQSITKPMRLNLKFDVTVTGDELRGYSRAGRLPRTSVIGHRASET